MTSSTPPMRNEVMWAIRDARELSSREKAFLWCVESRGVMFATQARAAADMGLSRSAFYKTRQQLLDRKLIRAHRRGTNSTTQYRVNADAVCGLVPEQPPAADTEQSWWETPTDPTSTPADAASTEGSTLGREMSQGGDTGVRDGGPEVLPEVDNQNEQESDHSVATQHSTSRYEPGEISNSCDNFDEQTSTPEESDQIRIRPLRLVLDSFTEAEKQQLNSLATDQKQAVQDRKVAQQVRLSRQMKEIIDRRLELAAWSSVRVDARKAILEVAWDQLDVSIQDFVADAFDYTVDKYVVVLGWIVQETNLTQ